MITLDGFLFIHKPTGLTSHDVVNHIRKSWQLDKVGHTGTLDPFASGLLVLCIGSATKLAYLFQNLDKRYEGIMVFGLHYDTLDTTGEVLATRDVTFDEQAIKAAAETFKGDYLQTPPMYSAIKQAGTRLYRLARKGQEVEREPRTVHVHDLVITGQVDDHTYRFHAHVSKGTYVRSLAADLAGRLGTFGALKTLVRTDIGPYQLDQAVNMYDASPADLLTLEQYFAAHQVVVLNDYMVKLCQNGVYLDQRQIKTDQPFVATDSEGKPIAYYEPVETHRYKPILIFKE